MVYNKFLSLFFFFFFKLPSWIWTSASSWRVWALSICGIFSRGSRWESHYEDLNTLFKAMQMQAHHSACCHRVSASPLCYFHPFPLQWSTLSLLCLIGLSVMLGIMMGWGLKVLDSELITLSLAGRSFARRWREQAPTVPCEREAAIIVWLTLLPATVSFSLFAACCINIFSEVMSLQLLSCQLNPCHLNPIVSLIRLMLNEA